MHPPGQGGHDHPHRHSRSALPARRPQAVRRARHPLRPRGGAQHRRAIRRRQARRARGAHPQAPGNRATWSSPTSRTAKAACAICIRLFWIAKYVYRVREPDELLKRGVFDKQEYQLFRRCEDFLWAVRCHMHFITGRAEERLSFDIQREIAVRLGYTAHPGMKDVERFMKHYFLVAKDVGDLTAILSAELEDSHAKSVPVLSRMMARLRPARRRALAGSDDFVVDNNRITVANANVFKRDPVNLIRIFRLAQKNNLAFHPDAMRADHPLAQSDRRQIARGQAGQRPVPGNPHLAARPGDGAAADERGRRARQIRAGLRQDRVDDAVQHVPPLHGGRAPVALHRHARGVRARRQGDAARQRADPEDSARPTARCSTSRCSCTTSPRAASRTIPSPARAWRGASARGSDFPPADTETVAWLIENHLVMSSVAQSRDLSDRKTIENFAAVVQSAERLKLLTILTTADIRAVGPGVWNGWKAQLIRTLYYETEPVLDRRLLRDQPRPARGAWRRTNSATRSRSGRRPSSTPISPSSIRPIGSRSTCRTSSSTPASCRRPTRPARRWPPTSHFDGGAVTELTVLAPDHPWLLSIIAGACAMAGANIVDAQIYTTTDGRALDTISLTPRIRARRGRAAARRPHRRFDREGAARRTAPARRGDQARAAEGPHQGLRAGALGHHQQSVVAPLHHGGGRPASTAPACSTS